MVPKHSFTIGYSASGYTLQQSPDYDFRKSAEDNANAHWDDCADPTSPDTTHNVNFAPANNVFRLRGNTDNVVVTY